MSDEGLDYAIKQTKEIYLSILDAEGDKLMHQWDRAKTRDAFWKSNQRVFKLV